MELTRPDLKVVAPKGYTPTLTTRPVVAGVSSIVNTVVKTPSPGDRKSTSVTQTTKTQQSKTESKPIKKEKKSSKKTDLSNTLLSPPSVKSESPSPKLSKKTSSPSVKSKEKDLAKEQREKEKREKREKEKREKALKREKEIIEREKKLQREKEAAAREEEAAAREEEAAKEKERQRELELEKLKAEEECEEREKLEEEEEEKSLKGEDVFDDIENDDVIVPSEPSPDRTYLLHAPRRSDSPTSSLFSPPRVRIASYQSDKKKKSLNKEKEGKKHNKKDANDSKHKNDKKSSSKHKSKKSPTLSSPSSSIKSPPSVRSDILSPPRLSQPIIKQASNKTVIFPPDSSPDHSITKTAASPSPRLTYSEQKTVLPAIIKTKFSPFDDSDDDIIEEGIKSEEEKVSPLKVSAISSSRNSGKSDDLHVTRHPTDKSESEIDVLSLSQGEDTHEQKSSATRSANYSESFQPDMFFPTKFKEEKKKKKKKKSEKDRDEKLKKVFILLCLCEFCCLFIARYYSL